MHFEDINESGKIERIAKDRPLFRFEYVNNFYSSCTFTARIVERKGQPLSLDVNSISVETQEIKKGSLRTLLSVAKVFFKAKLVEYSSLEQLGDDPSFQK